MLLLKQLFLKYVLIRIPNTTAAVHCGYMKDALAGFCEQILKNKNSEVILGKIDKKLFSRLADFGY